MDLVTLSFGILSLLYECVLKFYKIIDLIIVYSFGIKFIQFDLIKSLYSIIYCVSSLVA